MPKFNIAAYTAQKLAKKEANSAKARETLRLNTARQPIDLSEPHANTDFLDIPCTPIATTAEPSKPQVAPFEVVARAFS